MHNWVFHWILLGPGSFVEKIWGVWESGIRAARQRAALDCDSVDASAA